MNLSLIVGVYVPGILYPKNTCTAVQRSSSSIFCNKQQHIIMTGYRGDGEAGGTTVVGKPRLTEKDGDGRRGSKVP